MFGNELRGGQIILEKAISSSAEVELTELNEAIRWVEGNRSAAR
jgi:hypothetical protein